MDFDKDKITDIIFDADCFIYPVAFAAGAGGLTASKAVSLLDKQTASLHESLGDLFKSRTYSRFRSLSHFHTLSGSPKFRDQFRNVIPYKENRATSKIKPAHVRDLVDHYTSNIWGHHKACLPEVGEADDYIAMKATEAGHEHSLIIGVDKDLLQIPGWHYNPKKDNLQYVSPQQGLCTLYRQILIGDSADNIPGCKGIGPVGAALWVHESHTEERMYNNVVAAYMNHNKGQTEDDIAALIYETANLVYLRRHMEDYWNPYGTK